VLELLTTVVCIMVGLFLIYYYREELESAAPTPVQRAIRKMKAKYGFGGIQIEIESDYESQIANNNAAAVVAAVPLPAAAVFSPATVTASSCTSSSDGIDNCSDCSDSDSISSDFTISSAAGSDSASDVVADAETDAQQSCSSNSNSMNSAFLSVLATPSVITDSGSSSSNNSKNNNNMWQVEVLFVAGDSYSGTSRHDVASVRTCLR
jgi:hypothetical protein